MPSLGRRHGRRHGRRVARRSPATRAPRRHRRRRRHRQVRHRRRVLRRRRGRAAARRAGGRRCPSAPRSPLIGGGAATRPGPGARAGPPPSAPRRHVAAGTRLAARPQARRRGRPGPRRRSTAAGRRARSPARDVERTRAARGRAAGCGSRPTPAGSPRRAASISPRSSADRAPTGVPCAPPTCPRRPAPRPPRSAALGRSRHGRADGALQARDPALLPDHRHRPVRRDDVAARPQPRRARRRRVLPAALLLRAVALRRTRRARAQRPLGRRRASCPATACTSASPSRCAAAVWPRPSSATPTPSASTTLMARRAGRRASAPARDACARSEVGGRHDHRHQPRRAGRRRRDRRDLPAAGGARRLRRASDRGPGRRRRRARASGPSSPRPSPPTTAPATAPSARGCCGRSTDDCNDPRSSEPTAMTTLTSPDARDLVLEVLRGIAPGPELDTLGPHDDLRDVLGLDSLDFLAARHPRQRADGAAHRGGRLRPARRPRRLGATANQPGTPGCRHLITTPLAGVGRGGPANGHRAAVRRRRDRPEHDRGSARVPRRADVPAFVLDDPYRLGWWGYPPS